MVRILCDKCKEVVAEDKENKRIGQQNGDFGFYVSTKNLDFILTRHNQILCNKCNIEYDKFCKDFF